MEQPVIRRIVAALVVAGIAVIGLAAARPPQGTPPTGAPNDSSMLVAREAAWRDYFAAGPGLATVLPENFVGLSGGDSVSRGRAVTLEGSKQSAASGSKLVALTFPKNLIQRHGNVVVIHSRYEATLQRGKESETLRGWITESFVWDGTKWMHPSWHMSSDSCCR
jgi:hypothetical protein